MKSKEEVPEKILNKKLYQRVRARVIEEQPQTSAYRSLRIIKEYKKEGGKIDPKAEKKSDLTRWLREKWIQVRPYLETGEIVDCGENKGAKACRPLKRIDEKTPITLPELIEKVGKKTLMKAVKQKEANPAMRMRWIDLQRGNSPMKLLEVKDSPKEDKKLRAVFQYNTGKTKNVDFGAKGYRDFILISNPDSKYYLESKEEREKVREAYRERHDNEAEAEALKRADTPASLSMFILWGDSPSITQNIKAFRKKFRV